MRVPGVNHRHGANSHPDVSDAGGSRRHARRRVRQSEEPAAGVPSRSPLVSSGRLRPSPGDGGHNRGRQPGSARPISITHVATPTPDFRSGRLGRPLAMDAARGVWRAIGLPTVRRTSLVRALLQDQQDRVWAGTEGDGVFVSFDRGITWRAVNDGLTVPNVFSLAVDSEGRVVAGTAAGVFAAR
jgi:hypothetical protein